MIKDSFTDNQIFYGEGEKQKFEKYSGSFDVDNLFKHTTAHINNKDFVEINNEYNAAENDKRLLQQKIHIGKIGIKGEENAAYNLEFLRNIGYRVFPNRFIALEKGNTAEIDNIVVGKNGIFLLEVKTPGDGRIISYNDRLLSGIKNQMFRHYSVISKILEGEVFGLTSEHYHSVACISKIDKFVNVIIDRESFCDIDICAVDEILPFIAQYDTKAELSQEQIDRISVILERYKDKHEIDTILNKYSEEIEILDRYLSLINILKNSTQIVNLENAKIEFQKLGEYKKAAVFVDYCDRKVKNLRQEAEEMAEKAKEYERERLEKERLQAEKKKEAEKQQAIRAEELRKASKKKRRTAATVIIIICICISAIIVCLASQNQIKLNHAKKLMKEGSYETAQGYLESIKDKVPEAEKLITECKQTVEYNKNLAVYSEAISDMDNGNYEKAKLLFEQLGNFENSRAYSEKCSSLIYDKAIENYNNGDYSAAIDMFKLVPENRDTREYIDKASLLSDINVGDKVIFGGIVWSLINIEPGKYYTLLAEDNVGYGEPEDCPELLNGDFYNAFTDYEKSLILPVSKMEKTEDQSYFAIANSGGYNVTVLTKYELEQYVPAADRCALSGEPYWLAENYTYFDNSEIVEGMYSIFSPDNLGIRPVIRVAIPAP